MKTRFACRLARSWSALRADSASRHLASCPDCQAAQQRVHALESALRAAAPAARVSASSRLEADILRAVRTAGMSSPEEAPAPRRTSSWLASVGVAGALAAAAFVVVYRASLSELSPRMVARDLAALSSTVESLSSGFTETVLPAAGTMLADNPLQDEFSAVYADAQNAVNFLALNFLPGTPPPPATRTL